MLYFLLKPIWTSTTFSPKSTWVMFQTSVPSCIRRSTGCLQDTPITECYFCSPYPRRATYGQPFEEVLFRPLLKYGANGILLKATDLCGARVNGCTSQKYTTCLPPSYRQSSKKIPPPKSLTYSYNNSSINLPIPSVFILPFYHMQA